MNPKQSLYISIVGVTLFFIAGLIVLIHGFQTAEQEASTLDASGRQRMLSQWIRYDLITHQDASEKLEELKSIHKQLCNSEEDTYFIPVEGKQLVSALGPIIEDFERFVGKGELTASEIAQLDRTVELWISGMDKVNLSIIEGHQRLMNRTQFWVIVLAMGGVSMLILLAVRGFLPIYREFKAKELEYRDLNDEYMRANEHLMHLNQKVAHDLRNPLQTISMNLEMAHTKLQFGLPNAEEHITRSQRVIDMLTSTVDQLLKRTNLNKVDLKEVSFAEEIEVLKDRISAQIQRTSATLELRGEHDDKIICDVEAFRSILQNLVSNAIKYGRKGVPPHVLIEYNVGRDQRELTVADNGRGISEDHLPHIFEAHYRGSSDDKEGRGVGLLRVKELVEAHGWTISVKSIEGMGSQFCIDMAQVPSFFNNVKA